MRIQTDAIAGTLESSDALVRVSPHTGIDITVSSTVLAQYGEQIRAVIDETVVQLGLTDGSIIIDDKGALDCTIRARVQAAIFRGAGEKPDWSTLK